MSVEIIRTINGDFKVPAGDQSIICYIDDEASGLKRWNETALEEKLTATLFSKKDSLFLDIGSNMGYFSRVASKHSSHVIAVEPSLKNYILMLSNSADLNNIIPIRSLAGDRLCNYFLYANTMNCADNRVFLDDFSYDVEDVTMLTVESILDKYVECFGIPKNIIAKIDTQGTDHLVVQGFGKYKDLISDCFVECWPHGFNANNDTNLNTFSFYENLGYDINKVDCELDQIDDNSYCNLHLTRR